MQNINKRRLLLIMRPVRIESNQIYHEHFNTMCVIKRNNWCDISHSVLCGAIPLATLTGVRDYRNTTLSL